jgi:hypothetical protein
MSKRCFFFFALLISSAAAVCQSSQPLAPETVDISNGTLHLKGYLWKPAGPGPFPAVLSVNDYDTTPGTSLAAELERLHKPNVLKVYPPVGQTPSEGHNFLYTDISLWESDVFKFLDDYVKQ